MTATGSQNYVVDGLRHSRTVRGNRTYHIWNWGQIAFELNDSGQLVNRFIAALPAGHRVRSHHHGFYMYNVRGDVVQRVDGNGAVLHTYQYNAFGNIADDYEQYSNNPFRFGGEFWDWEREEYYLRARSYNPRLGRFTQPDPFWGVHNMQGSTAAIMQSANLFVFGMNNPGRWLDPSGLFVVDLTHNQIDDARAPAVARGSRSSTVSTPSRAAQFGQGVVSGFTGFYSGIVHAVTNPVQTITNYYLGLIGDPVGTATSILMPILPLHINAAVQTFSIANSHRQLVSAHGVYGAGILVGEFGAQVTTFVVGYGAGKLVGYATGQMMGPIANPSAGLYLAGKAPQQVSPGTRILHGQHVNNLGRVEPWIAHYDQFGRLIGRTDFNAANITQNIPGVHHHVFRWGIGEIAREVASHIPGVFRP